MLCGDPDRCLALATVLTDRPLMFNHARGLWGYTGTASDGEALTIQATGLGAASAAIVTGELCALGARTLVRLGTARTLGPEGSLRAGDVACVTRALAGDGPSRALGAGDSVEGDAALTERLAREAGATAIVASADLAHPAGADLDAWARAGAGLVDLQTAVVLQSARTHRVAAGAVLVATGAVDDDDATLDDPALLAAVTRAAHAVAAALGLPARTAPPLGPPRDDERAII